MKLQQTINQLEVNLRSPRSLCQLYDFLHKQSFPNIDTEELLRAAIASAVSAFDYCMTELLIAAVVEMYDDSSKIKFSNKALKDSTAVEILHWLSLSKQQQLVKIEEKVRQKYGSKTFQHPKNIKKYLQESGVCQGVWNEVANKIEGMNSASDVMEKVRLIMERRNRIVHEADIDIVTNSKRTIEMTDVVDDIDFLEKVCKSVYDIITI